MTNLETKIALEEKLLAELKDEIKELTENFKEFVANASILDLVNWTEVKGREFLRLQSYISERTSRIKLLKSLED